jgi:hypothetical protein
MEFSFFFPTKDRGGSHIVGCLMQGLQLLGHKIYSNAPMTEFKSHGIFPPFSRLMSEDIQITSDLSRGHLIVDAFNGLGDFEKSLKNSARNNKIVLLDMNDGCNLRDYDDNFLVFITHFNKLALRGGKIFPIGFGLSEEAIQLAGQHIFSERKKDILRNFRPSNNQSVRNGLDLSLLPLLRDHFMITESFSDPDQYIRDLLTHKAVLAYGGDLYKDLRQNEYFASFKDLVFKEIASEPVVLRFDSWRFYEAALFGCCPISLDFDRYGLETSANPMAWSEYIPIDFSRIETTTSRIVEEVSKDSFFLEKIGLNARKWVINNHSPRATAMRVLETMTQHQFL